MKISTNLSKIGAADIIGNGITAAFWFFIASLMTPSEYGELSYYLGIAGIASFMIMLGTENTITVYVAKKIPIHTALYLISLLLFIPAAIILFIIFNRIDILILALAYTIGNLAVGEIFGNRKYNSYFTHVLIQKSLTFVLGLFFFYQFGVVGLIIALALTYAPYAYRIVKEFKSIKIDFTLLKNRWGFIINNYTIILTYGFWGQIDKLIVMPLLGSSVLGNYSLALQVIMVLTILPSIIFKYLLPQESHGQNPAGARKILIMISGLITVLGFFVVPEIIPIFYPKFDQAIEAVKIMSISFLPSSIVRIYTSKLLSMEKSRFILISQIISVTIMTTSMILLGDMFGLNGIAASYVMSLVIQAGFLFLINRKMYR